MESATIIVVDDSPFAAKQIKDLIEGHDFEVVGYARNGEEGIQLYEALKPDIVIMDIIMPGIDGIEAAELILKMDPNASILMLSSLCDTGTLDEIESIGLKYLLPKPWDDDILLSTMDILSGQKEKEMKQ